MGPGSIPVELRHVFLFYTPPFILIEGESSNISNLTSGNCKLHRVVLKSIDKFSMGKINRGGSCKLQLPEVKFKMFQLSPFSKIKEGVEL